MLRRLACSGLIFAMLCIGAHARSSASNFLFVSAYDGKVTTVDLGPLSAVRPGSGPVQLRVVSASTACTGSPSFLTLDKQKSTVFCLDESLQAGGGSLAALKTNNDGSATLLSRKDSPAGPVFGALLASANRLVVAHYAEAAVSLWDVSDPLNLRLLQNQSFKLDKPGHDKDRQTGARPHQTLVDPTGRYVVVPDLGADLVRVFKVGCGDKKELKHVEDVAVEPGSGPRHAAFTQPKNGRAWMVLVNELKPTVTVFEVSYASATMRLHKMSSFNVHGRGKTAAKNAYPSEVVISPDNKFVMISSRNEYTSTLPNLDPKNSTEIKSDPIINFPINQQTGRMAVLEELPSGGGFPRHFSLNRAGTLLAVGLQKDKRVTIITRDATTGRLGTRPVAFVDVSGEVTSVIFDE